MRAGHALIATLLTGCAPDAVFNVKTPDVVTVMPLIEVTPAFLQFGERVRTDRVTATLRFDNTGDSTLDIEDIRLEGADSFGLTLSDPLPLSLGFEGTTTVEVSFQPRQSGYLEAAVVVVSDADNAPELRVPVAGVGAVADIVVMPDPVVFDARPIGCPTLRVVTVGNQGQEPLDVTSVEVMDPSGQLAMGAPLPEGLVLRRGEEWRFTLTLDPLEEGTSLADIVIDSSDPDGVLTVPVAFEVEPLALQEDVFTVPDTWPVDVLFTVDQSCSMADQAAIVASQFEAFANRLSAARADWRVGVFTGNDAGCLQSGVLTPQLPDWADRFRTAAVTVTGPGTTLGNSDLSEAALEGLGRVADADVAGGCNEGMRRPGVPLHVVVVTDERDQSTGWFTDPVTYWEGYRDRLFDYAGVPELFTLHGVLDLQSVCGQEPLGPGGYLEVAQQTGGELLDVCGPFGTDFLDLAGSVADVHRFGLTGSNVLEDSITVTVDGASAASGWAYEPGTNEVVFEDAPPAGSTVVVRYRSVGDCPG